MGQLIYRMGQIGIAYMIGSEVLGAAMARLDAVAEALRTATQVM